MRNDTPEPPSATFWNTFWRLIETPPGPREQIAYTVLTAQMAGQLSADLHQRVADAALTFPGVPEAAASGMPGRFDLNDLIRCPSNSLGGAFYRQVVSDGMRLEAGDRDLMGLAALPYPLNYVNTRILQCHHLIRIVAGYETTSLHQMGLSAFLMGQCGYHYSSMFVGAAMTAVAMRRPPGVPAILDTILGGWTHGRQTPLLLGAPWESLWHLPVQTVRERLGILPFPVAHPADLLERAASR
jgi:ubiquinone biosynthesis protein Coq4